VAQQLFVPQGSSSRSGLALNKLLSRRPRRLHILVVIRGAI
jgi:hypothetical protein